MIYRFGIILWSVTKGKWPANTEKKDCDEGRVGKKTRKLGENVVTGS